MIEVDDAVEVDAVEVDVEVDAVEVAVEVGEVEVEVVDEVEVGGALKCTLFSNGVNALFSNNTQVFISCKKCS